MSGPADEKKAISGVLSSLLLAAAATDSTSAPADGWESVWSKGPELPALATTVTYSPLELGWCVSCEKNVARLLPLLPLTPKLALMTETPFSRPIVPAPMMGPSAAP